MAPSTQSRKSAKRVIAPGKTRLVGPLLIATEVELLNKLNHPNIIVCHGVHFKEKEIWIILEYADGGSLGSLIQTYGKLPEKTVAIYLKQILDGLIYLHKQNVIHRDIKPDNVLLNSRGQVKLSDFGCSQQMMNSQTKEEMVKQLKGSIPYMAPEAMRQEILSRKADVWSLGCLALELATGVPPWSQHDMDNVLSLMYKIGSNDEIPIIPADLSEETKDFLERCLQRDISKRATSSDLLDCKIFTKFKLQNLC